MKPYIKNKRRDARKIKELVQQIHADVFDPRQPDIGGYNKRFATQWQQQFLQAFGSDGSTLCRMKLPEFSRVAAEFWGPMDKQLEPKRTQAMKLQDFSNWLAEFEQSDQSSPEVHSRSQKTEVSN
jgi:hypothetical protein